MWLLEILNLHMWVGFVAQQIEELTKFLPKKTKIKLDRIVKSNHFRTLEVDQISYHIWKALNNKKKELHIYEKTSGSLWFQHYTAFISFLPLVIPPEPGRPWGPLVPPDSGGSWLDWETGKAPENNCNRSSKQLGESVSCSVEFDSFLPPARLLCPWNSPRKKTGLGNLSLLQEILLTQGLNWTWVSHIADRFFTVWATREAPNNWLETCILAAWYWLQKAIVQP